MGKELLLKITIEKDNEYNKVIVYENNYYKFKEIISYLEDRNNYTYYYETKDENALFIDIDDNLNGNRATINNINIYIEGKILNIKQLEYAINMHNIALETVKQLKNIFEE